MDDIPKIEFKPTQTAALVVPQVQAPVEQPAQEEVQVHEKSAKKFPILPFVLVVILMLLVVGGYAAFKKFVVWDDGVEADTASRSSAYIPINSPTPNVQN